MAGTLTIWVPGLPIAQPRARATTQAGRILVYGAKSGHAIHDWKAAIRLAADRAMGHELALADAPIRLEVWFLFPRTKAMMKKGVTDSMFWHINKPDTDNLVKGLKDAITSVVWADDCAACSEHVHKVWCGSCDPCGSIIEVTRIYEAPMLPSRLRHVILDRGGEV